MSQDSNIALLALFTSDQIGLRDDFPMDCFPQYKWVHGCGPSNWVELGPDLICFDSIAIPIENHWCQYSTFTICIAGSKVLSFPVPVLEHICIQRITATQRILVLPQHLFYKDMAINAIPLLCIPFYRVNFNMTMQCGKTFDVLFKEVYLENGRRKQSRLEPFRHRTNSVLYEPVVFHDTDMVRLDARSASTGLFFVLNRRPEFIRLQQNGANNLIDYSRDMYEYAGRVLSDTPGAFVLWFPFEPHCLWNDTRTTFPHLQFSVLEDMNIRFDAPTSGTVYVWSQNILIGNKGLVALAYS